jgi:hypothetical protein
MPQQLKIIVGPNYEVNAPFTVNFNAPVIVKPGNKITLDKFTANIRNITSNFALPESPFTFYYGLNFPNLQSSTVTIPGRTYENLLDLLDTMNQLINNTFTAYRTGYTPSTSFLYDRDLGLKVYCSTTSTSSTSSSTTNVFQIQYATSDLVLNALDATNMTTGAGGFAYPTADGLWAVASEVTLLRGGGILLTYQINVASTQDAIDNNMNYISGITSTESLLFYGLQQNNQGELYLAYGNYNTGTLTKTLIDRNDFPNSDVGDDLQYYVSMYQVNGQWALRSYTKTISTGGEVTLYDSNIDNPGALGAFDVTTSYSFLATGTSTNIAWNSPQINLETCYSTPDIAMDASETTGVQSRTVAFDMTNSRALRAGLDVPSGQMILTPTNSPFGQFKCQTGINMSIINTAFDIAIEILDLPLQTFQASSDRKPGSRVNVVSYFHPELSNFGAGTYIYDSRANVWLDIDITYPVNLSSLSFRVYDPSTGIGLDASAMSFNLLIGTTEY